MSLGLQEAPSHSSLNHSKQTNDSESSSTPDDVAKAKNDKKKSKSKKKSENTEKDPSKSSGDKDQDSEPGSSKRKTCEICCDQMLLVSNTTHFYTHARSDFVAQLMKKLYTKSSNIKMINCRECLKNPNAVRTEGKRFSAIFNHMFTFKHLCDNHIVEFRGHEKEFLKYINFFSMIHKVDKAHNNIIDAFEFTYPQMLELSEIYFSLTSEEQARKQLIMGKLYHRLQQDIETKGLKPNVTPQIQKLIDSYLKSEKKLPKNQPPNSENIPKNPKEIPSSAVTLEDEGMRFSMPVKHEFHHVPPKPKTLPLANSSENISGLKRHAVEDHLPYDEKVKKVKSSSFEANPVDIDPRGYQNEHPPPALSHGNIQQQHQSHIFSQIQKDQNAFWELIMQSESLNKKMREKMNEITEKLQNADYLNQHLFQRNQRLEAENGMLREQLHQSQDRAFQQLELKKETD